LENQIKKISQKSGLRRTLAWVLSVSMMLMLLPMMGLVALADVPADISAIIIKGEATGFGVSAFEDYATVENDFEDATVEFELSAELIANTDLAIIKWTTTADNAVAYLFSGGDDAITDELGESINDEDDLQLAIEDGTPLVNDVTDTALADGAVIWLMDGTEQDEEDEERVFLRIVIVEEEDEPTADDDIVAAKIAIGNAIPESVVETDFNAQAAAKTYVEGIIEALGAALKGTTPLVTNVGFRAAVAGSHENWFGDPGFYYFNVSVSKLGGATQTIWFWIDIIPIEVTFAMVTISSVSADVSGEGYWPEGGPVEIFAGQAPAGHRFKEWTAAPGVVWITQNPYNPDDETLYGSTTQASFFTMPDGPVALTATFEPIPATITGIRINPGPVTVQTGQTFQFSALVEGLNNPDQAVTWSLDPAGPTDATSNINAAGLLTINAAETVETLTIKAVSVGDITKEATVLVTVSGDPVTTAVTGITITPTSTTLLLEGTQTFRASVLGTNPPQGVTWTLVGGNTAEGSEIDSSTGVLTISATETLTTLTVRATTTHAGTGTGTFGEATVTVALPLVNAQQPNITAHPQGRYYMQGETPDPLSVTVESPAADGGVISYQWYSTDQNWNTETPIQGATSSTFLPSTAAAGVFYYFVAVTNTNVAVSGSQTARRDSVRVEIYVESTGGGGVMPDTDPGDVPPINNANDFVKGLFQFILGRDSDPAGLDYWVNELLSGNVPGRRIGVEFVNSDEFKGLMSSLSPEDLITTLYRGLLGREPDAEGFAYWVSEINRGVSLAGIARTFAEIGEFRALLASIGIAW